MTTTPSTPHPRLWMREGGVTARERVDEPVRRVSPEEACQLVDAYDKRNQSRLSRRLTGSGRPCSPRGRA
jgi:hypothetical protein